MRQLIVISALLAAASPAAAQNQVAPAQAQSTKPATSKAAAKPSDKICKRMSAGKVCLTAKQWKQYEEMN